VLYRRSRIDELKVVDYLTGTWAAFLETVAKCCLYDGRTFLWDAPSARFEWDRAFDAEPPRRHDVALHHQVAANRRAGPSEWSGGLQPADETRRLVNL
jgi:hypothetical protein